jgi:hypothetical protein
MRVLTIKSWRKRKNGENEIPEQELGRILTELTPLQGLALKRLIIRTIHRQLINVPVREDAQPGECLDFLNSYGAEACVTEARVYQRKPVTADG